MKTRGVIGKKIVAIKQRRFWNGSVSAVSNEVEWIELDNGVRLVPVVEETEDEYAVDFVVARRSKK